MKHSSKIVINGEAHEDNKYENGDLIFIIEEVKDNIFKRENGYNLKINKDILLTQALCGFDFIITHLDNRKLYINIEDVITPNLKKELLVKGLIIKEI